MYAIDNQSRVPVYEQIVAQAERFVMMDLLKADEPMQSVRSLSIELSVNPNTIQKAYAELERRGVIYVVPGKGSFVSPQAKDKIAQSKLSLLADIENISAECALAGIEKNRIIDAVERGYNRNGGNKE